MRILRRALQLGLGGLWRGPACGGGRRPALHTGLFRAGRFSASAGGQEPRRQWGASQGEEEEFIFPEYLLQGDPPSTPPLAGEPGGASEGRPERDPRPPRRLKPPRKEHRVTGRPDPSVPFSGVGCSGCGAELHCKDPSLPGYLPSEKYLTLVGSQDLEEEEDAQERPPHMQQTLEDAVCQRCWLLVHHQRALQVQVSQEEYRNLVSTALRGPPRHNRPPLALCMVDMLDLPDSLLPNLPELVGDKAHIFVLGNKVDMIPGDSPGYLKRLQERLLKTCIDIGLLESKHPKRTPGQRVVDVHLLSAKTGYGVEALISKLQRSWKFNGDVYLVGAVNTGKSTLFNALLHSDYCKSRASDVINRATISPWPGTTLNLLKFPIINPTPYRIFRREARLMADAKKTEEELSEDEQKQLCTLKKQGYLIGRIGRTFRLPQKMEKNREIDFDAEALSINTEEEPAPLPKLLPQKEDLTYNEVKDARWFFDTPGIVKDGCVLNLLKEKEVKFVLPTYAIVPRTFVLKPGMTLFLGALGRIDYLEGTQSSWFSVVASHSLPVHITSVEKADAVYQKHAGQELLKVPMGGEERMKDFPSLVPQDVTLEGIGIGEAVADIKLSSAGWVAVTAHSNNKMQLKCYTPEGTTLTIRKPPLLPYVVHIKGSRLKGSSAYRTKRPPPLVENLKKVDNKKEVPF